MEFVGWQSIYYDFLHYAEYKYVYLNFKRKARFSFKVVMFYILVYGYWMKYWIANVLKQTNKDGKVVIYIQGTVTWSNNS